MSTAPQPQAGASLRGQHVVSVSQFDRPLLERIFDLAERCLPAARGEQRVEALRGRVLVNLFFEPSTRTRLSFGTAFARLGGAVETTVGFEFSSMAKGETLEDTMRVLEGYADCIVLRHPTRGSVARAASVCSRPVINAGDGAGEHPSQALLDLFTIQRERGGIDGVRIALVGDLRFGRTVHSLSLLVSRFRNVSLLLASPPSLAMPPEVLAELDAHGVRYEVRPTVRDALVDADVAYVTRLQQERFDDPAEAARLIGSYVVNRELIQSVGRANDLTILHPLPRLHDLSTDVDELPGAAYFRQAHNGVPVRMALFCEIFGVGPDA
jgi:aspartate carbamoyltransferase catalytic subunit